jgi:hypothetical protein
MVGIAAVRHRPREPPAHTDITLRLPQQQCTAVGRLIAAFEIDAEFLAADGGQIERKQRIVGHGGCGTGLYARQLVGTTICYVNRPLSARVAAKLFSVVHNPG